MGLVNTTIPTPSVVTLLLGVSTVVSQSLLVREAMAAMGGSEIAWGLVMALWLVGMGVGARLGIGTGSRSMATSLPVATLILTAVGTTLFRAAPAIVAAAPGETLTTWHAVWLWALAVVPAAIAGGVAFPILAGSLGSSGPGRAYALEAVGALVGGLTLSFVLIPLGTVGTLLVVLGIVSSVLTWPRQRVLALMLAVSCCVFAIPAGGYFARASWRWSGQPGELGSWVETRHQRLEVSTGPPFSLYADGRLNASYPDPYDTVPRAHLMMLLHPEPRRVLAIGCAADGSAEAMIQHRPDELILVEEDPHILPLLGRWFGTAFQRTLDDSTVRLRPTDPIRAVDRESNLDLIILADGDPTTLRANRTRTLEFFRRCRTSMADDGVLVLEVGVNDTYLGGDGGRLLAMFATTLREVFPQIATLPGERVLLVAAGADVELDTSFVALEKRLNERPDVGESLHPVFLELLLDPARQPILAAFLDTVASDLNTSGHPRAVSLAVGLHEARSRSGWSRVIADLEPRGSLILLWILVGTVTIFLTLTVTTSTPVRATIAAWAIGFVSMGWWLLLLASWQTTQGSVYAEIGFLTAAFMAGVAAGGWLGLRTPSPARSLPWIIISGVGLSLILSSGPTPWAPTLTIPVLLTAGGVLTGSAFPGLGALAGGGLSRRGAGLAFAADELGAATAALIIGTTAIPWVGMTTTAVGLAVVGLAAIPAVVRA